MQVQLFGQGWSFGRNLRSKLAYFEYSTPIWAEIPKLIIRNDPKSAKIDQKYIFWNRLNSHPDTLYASRWAFFLNSLIQIFAFAMLIILYKLYSINTVIVECHYKSVNETKISANINPFR
jgi:hypothetical protein